MGQILIICHVIIAFGIIGLVLLQHGKGAEVGASFGSGASQTIFGSRGSKSFLARFTAILACLFAITSLGLSYVSTRQQAPKTILERIEAQELHEGAVMNTDSGNNSHPVSDLPEVPSEKE